MTDEIRAELGDTEDIRAELGEVTVGQGVEGWTPRLTRTSTAVEIRYERPGEQTSSATLFTLAEVAGADGASVELGASPTHIQARRVESDGTLGGWYDVVALSDIRGLRGLSAYAVAVENGFPGSVTAWLASLKGDDGDTPELPSFVASSTVGVPGSVPTVSAEKVDGEVRFSFVLPPARDGNTPPPLNLSVTATEVGQGQPMTASISGSYPDLALTLALRAGPTGGTGLQGAGGTPNVDLVGTGVPNGSATAQPGTIYKDLAKTYGVRLWIKDTGTNNQGWVPLAGDTGIRDITSLQDPQYMSIATSKVTVQRFYNGNVTLAARCSPPANPTGSFNPRIYLPTGLWPEVSVNALPGESVLGSARALSSQIPTGFQWNWYIASGALRGFSTTGTIPMNGGFVAYATYACSQLPPTI